MSTRVRASNMEDYLKSKILDVALDTKEGYSRIFYYGQVINNDDPKHSNRIQVRIPVIDDNAYLDRKKDEGDKLLPWCSPFSRNFVSTPEHNSMVLVALLDPRTPYWGRMYFDSITDLNDNPMFDPKRLVPEEKTYNNWKNIEQNHNIVLRSKPQKDNEFNSKERVNYLMGLKGKGKNRVTLDKDNVSIYQNEKETKQSMLKFTENIKMEAYDIMELLSVKGNSTHYHPLFHTPVYNFMSKQNSLMKSIIQVMCSVPSLAPNTTPDLPSPEAIALLSPLMELYIEFNKLKMPGVGASKQIFIN